MELIGPPNSNHSKYIVLAYGLNPCYTRILDATDKDLNGLEINVLDQTWSYGNSHDIRIGTKKPLQYDSSPMKVRVIGVYNRESTEQLNSMIFHSHEALKQDDFFDCDD